MKEFDIAINELVAMLRNILEVEATNEFAGIDSIPNKPKSLEISCSINGVNKQLTALKERQSKLNKHRH